MVSIAIKHVMGVYLMHVIKKMAPVIIHQGVNLDGGMDILNVIKVYYINIVLLFL
jgi:hypothetical protein